MSRLDELMRIADTVGLNEHEKALVEAEFNFGVDKYKEVAVPPMQGLAGLYDFVAQSEDSGFQSGAHFLKSIVAKKDVIWPVVYGAQRINSAATRES